MKRLIKRLLLSFPPFNRYYSFRSSIINKVSLYNYRTNRLRIKMGGGVYWPVSKASEVVCPNNIYVGVNSNPGTRPGCYIQGNGGIYIGDFVQLASNIGVISANHDLNNQSLHINDPVVIGSYSWIGQGALIMPGVKLGKRVVVGAGSVVTKSFPEGWCVIAGNPAKKIKDLDPSLFVYPQRKFVMHGYLTEKEFDNLVLSRSPSIQAMKYLAKEIEEKL